MTDRRTFHWDDWDLEALLAHKARTGLTTSLVVPARNEAATVGDVVGRVREALVDTVQLLDSSLKKSVRWALVSVGAP